MALLIYAGTEVEDVHDTIPTPTKPELIEANNWTDYAKSKEKLTAYFSPKQCNDFALFQMMNLKTEPGQTITEYATKLREAGDKCTFTNWTAEMIKCILISNMQDEELRLKFLEKEHTLDEILETTRKREDATARSKLMTEDKDKIIIRKINAREDTRKFQRSSYKKEMPGRDEVKGRYKEPMKVKCTRCGYKKHKTEGECPANGQVCGHCQNKGHFASECFFKKKALKPKAVNLLQQSGEKDGDDDDSSTTEDEEWYGVSVLNDVLKVGKNTSLMKVNTNGIETKWQPDTGATKDIWDERYLRKVEKESGKPIPLEETDTELFAYGSTKSLELIGKFKALLEAGDNRMETYIYVTKEKSHHPLLSEGSARKLKLIKYNEKFLVQNVTMHMKKEGEMRKPIADVIKENEEVFRGEIGKLKNRQVPLMIDKSVKPVIQKCRRIPFNLMEQAEEKVQQLLKQDIIERAPDDEPRTWLSPPVIAPKPGSSEIRFCIDMRMANKAIQRPYTQIPNIGDIINKFQGATRFSKLDLKEAYHQFELTPESRNITTFHGPDGLYRYKRLNYGTKSAQDIMQVEMQRILSDIPNQVNLSDDILIGGKSMREHDETLGKVLATLKEHGLTVNIKKCVLDVEEISFVGLVFNSAGIKPDPKNVKNLKDADHPNNKKELRSFLGMAGYSEQFIPDFAMIAAPLRDLVKEKRWEWNENHEKSFRDLKEAISEESLLNHYVAGRETEIVVDASLSGLGAVLLQKRSKNEPFKPVVYKSRALKEVETRYSATEREALAIRWGAKKLRKYVLGAPRFKFVTDHKPLTYMFHKGHGDLPPRIERFVMDVQEFDYEVVYRPGKTCIADYMSRLHSPRTGSSQVEEIEQHVRSVMEVECCHVINKVSAVTLQDVREAARKCPLTQKLTECILKGSNSDDPELKPYRVPEIKHDLHVVDGLVCRGKRLVIPPSLQRKVVKLSHEGHQGMSKAKSLVRTFCWFPGIDNMVEKQVRTCLPCQAVRTPTHQEPIKPSNLPEGPWQYIEMDFQGPYPSGDYIFIMIDRYSHWPEMVFFKKAPNARTTMAAMKSVFANKGIPLICQSDNGPPFQSNEMRQFSEIGGFKHKHITPEWPRANGTVERFNRTMKEALQAGKVEGIPMKEMALDFISAYRATPHRATGVSPFAALHGGRQMRSKLPMLTPQDSVVNRDVSKRYKEGMIKNDKGREHSLKEGDTVIATQRKLNKMTPSFSDVPLKVVEVKGSMITAKSKTKTVTRDASQFRKILPWNNPDSDDEDLGDTPLGEAEQNGNRQDEVVEDEAEANGRGEAAVEPEKPVAEDTRIRTRRERRQPKYLEDYALQLNFNTAD